jgi:hypothetical protein
LCPEREFFSTHLGDIGLGEYVARYRGKRLVQIILPAVLGRVASVSAPGERKKEVDECPERFIKFVSPASRNAVRNRTHTTGGQ